MGPLRHFLIVVVIGVVCRWLWKSSLNERASVEAGRTVFPPTRAIRIFAVFENSDGSLCFRGICVKMRSLDD